jgi:hypothetical protein
MGFQTLNTGKYSSTHPRRGGSWLGSISAIFSSGDQIVYRKTLETRLRVTSRGAKTRNVKATGTGAILDSARSSEGPVLQGVFRLPLHDCTPCNY